MNGIQHGVAAGIALLTLTLGIGARGDETSELESRVRGLLMGALIGDALGGPVEFQDPSDVSKLPNPPKRWASGETLDESTARAVERRLMLRSYKALRPELGSYAHWSISAGAITDDSRHKIILMHALRKAREADRLPLTQKDLAKAFLDWPTLPVVTKRPQYRELCEDWLKEWLLPSRWVLGERDPAKALPPGRMWGGLATCCGQMSLPPLAALYPGKPEQAYRAAHDVAFFDNGIGKDLNASLVAGLAAALTSPQAESDPWAPVINAMRTTDPYHYNEVPWAKRPVDQWLEFSLAAAVDAEKEPARMFNTFEKKFAETIKWEAPVPFAVCFGCLTLSPRHPLAALQLTIEWGYDTDSYAQLTGAFIGARFGEDVFPKSMRDVVEQRLKSDYDESIVEWVELLSALRD